MPAEGAIQSETMARVTEHLNAVIAAAAKQVTDGAANKALVDSVKAVLRRLDDDREVIERYAEYGDPLNAVRGTFPPSVTPKVIQRLVEAGWAHPLLIGKKAHYRFTIGEPLGVEVGANVAKAKRGPS